MWGSTDATGFRIARTPLLFIEQFLGGLVRAGGRDGGEPARERAQGHQVQGACVRACVRKK